MLRKIARGRVGGMPVALKRRLVALSEGFARVPLDELAQTLTEALCGPGVG